MVYRHPAEKRWFDLFAQTGVNPEAASGVIGALSHR
jgi:hypothetical protein